MLSFVVMILASTCFVKIKVLYTLLKDQMFHERSKQINVKYHYVRGMVAQDKLKVYRISIYDNPADMMIKSVHVVEKFEFCSSLVDITI
jgi:hypothetical protein